MFRPRGWIAAVLALGALAACRSSAEPTAANDSLFVNTMGELRRIRTDPALDSAARDSAREAVLRTHDVSAEELEAMARALSQDPERALEAWREIERKSTQDESRPPARPTADSAASDTPR
ncbi:MAG TPA: hypothetical protein VFK39_09070 [Gemmatimonadaceae bacterium]|nr:hypothetical protein [Gemmatimonadaceae bacterium]